MNQPDQPHGIRARTDRGSGSSECAYCGAALDPGLYFCRNCSSPVQRIEQVLPNVSAPYLSDGKRVQLLAPGSIRVFWVYLSLILGIGILGAILYGTDGDTSGAFHVFFGIIFTAFTAGYALFHWDTLKPQLKRVGFGHRAAWIGLLILVPLLAVNYTIHVLFIEAIGGEEVLETENYNEIFASFPAAVVFIAVIPAITEEIAYRGLIQEWLQRALSPPRAITAAAFLFGISHFSVFSLPYLFAVGWLLGWMKWKTRSLFPSMLAHFLHNFAVIYWME